MSLEKNLAKKVSLVHVY